jgi:hypothetical protein
MKRAALWVLVLVALSIGCGGDGQRRATTDAGPPGPDAGARDTGEMLDAAVALDASVALDAGVDGGEAVGLCPGGALREPTARWTRTWPSAGNQQILSAIVDGSGAVLVTGRNQGTVDFGGGMLDAAGTHGVFVAKLRADGSHAWSVQFRDTGDDSEPKSIAVDAEGNVYVTGYVTGTIDLGGGPLAPATGPRNIFVLSLSSTGAHRWSRRFGPGTGWEIAVRPGGSDLVVTGEFSGSVSFGGDTLTSAGDRDVFVVSFAADGGHRWSRRFGGSRPDGAYGAAIDAAGNVVVVGDTYGGIDFGGGAIGSGITGYVAGLDPSGAHRFSRAMAGGTVQVATFAPDGDVLVQTDGSVSKLGPDATTVWTKAVAGSALPSSPLAIEGRTGVWAIGSVDLVAAGCTPLPAQTYVLFVELSLVDGSVLRARSMVVGTGEVPLWSIGRAPDGELALAGWVAGSGHNLGTGSTTASMVADPIVVRYRP